MFGTDSMDCHKWKMELRVKLNEVCNGIKCLRRCEVITLTLSLSLPFYLTSDPGVVDLALRLWLWLWQQIRSTRVHNAHLYINPLI